MASVNEWSEKEPYTLQLVRWTKREMDRWKEESSYVNEDQVVDGSGVSWVRIAGETYSDNIYKLQALATQKRALVLSHCTFTNPVELRLFEGLTGLVIDQCTFDENVEGRGVKFGCPVSLFRCLFNRSLTLPGARFARSLSIAGCYFGLEEDPVNPHSDDTCAEFNESPNRKRAAWWPNLHVKGMLRLDRSVFAGSLNLAEARIDGPLPMRGVRVGMARGSGRLHLRQMRVNGDVDMSPHVPGDRQFKFALRSTIRGSVTLAGSDIAGRLDIRGAIIFSRLHLPHAHIRDRIEANVWLHDNDHTRAFARRTHIGERRGCAVRMADAVVEHGVWFDGARLRGEFNAKNARIGGDLYLRQAIDHNLNRPLLGAARIRLRFVKSGAPIHSRIDQALQLLGATVGGSVDLTWTEFNGVVNLENAHVNGDVHLRGAKIAPSPNSSGPPMPELKLRMIRIGRTLDLRGADFAGEIVAHGASVEGDIRFGTWKRGEFREAQGLNRALSEDAKPANVIDEKPVFQIGRYSGRIDISNAAVNGELKFCYGVFDDEIVARGIRVKHRCDFTGGIYRKKVVFDDAEIDGSIEIGDPDYPSTLQPVGTYFAESLSLQRSTIHGNIFFYRAIFGAAPADGGLGIAERPRMIATRDEWPDLARPYTPEIGPSRVQAGPRRANQGPSPVLDLRLTTVEGSWLPGRPKDANAGNPPLLALYCGEVRAASLKVKGDVELMNVRSTGSKMSFDSAVIGGGFWLDDSRVDGELTLTGASIGGSAFTKSTEITSGGSPPLAPFPKVIGTINLDRSKIRHLALALCPHDESTEENPSGGPASVELKYATIGQLTISGRLPFEKRPFIAMEGLRFDELDVDHLKSEFEIEHGRTSSGFSLGSRFKRRLLFWAIPSPGAILAILAGVVALLSIPRSWTVLWHILFPKNPWVVAGMTFCLLIGLIDEIFFWKFVRRVGRKAVNRIADCIEWVRLLTATDSPRADAPAQPGGWYPKRYTLLLQQMPRMDAGVYARLESSLRKRSDREWADAVYIERRLYELESGIGRWFWHLGFAISVTVRGWYEDFREIGEDIKTAQRESEMRPRKFTPMVPGNRLWRSVRAFFPRQLWQRIQERVHWKIRAPNPASSERRERRRDALLDEIHRASRYGRMAFRHAKQETDDKKLVRKKMELMKERTPKTWRIRLFVRLCIPELAVRVGRLPRRVFEFLLLLFFGDGVRVSPAIILFLSFFCFSWLWVFNHHDSVTRPPVFVAPVELTDHARDQAWLNREVRSPGSRNNDIVDAAARRPWTRSDGFWIALRAHLPLLGLVGRENWRPSSMPVEVLNAPISAYNESGIRKLWLIGRFFPRVEVPTYETWAGITHVFGWFAVPLILGALGGFLRRRGGETESLSDGE